MTDRKLKKLEKDTVGKTLLSFIPNELGINLCSVEDIDIHRQNNGELKSITIRFIPENPEPQNDKDYSSAVPC